MITKKAKKSPRALVMLSGGLDSILSCAILKKQGIETTALVFGSYFFDHQKARFAADKLDIPLIIKYFSKKHLEIVKNPKHGYGSAMNPCIDCHALMIKMAKEIMTDNKFDIFATGEVLGQRPFSQNKRALELIEKRTEMQEKILRPLSAQLLDETEYEKKGLVDRKKLLAIMGKSRKVQLELAKQWGIDYYPTPSGGCRLAEKEFSQKLKELLEKSGQTVPSDF